MGGTGGPGGACCRERSWLVGSPTAGAGLGQCVRWRPGLGRANPIRMGEARTVEVGLSLLKSNACRGGRHPAIFTGLIASFATQLFHAPDRSIPGVSVDPPPFLVSLGFILRKGAHSWPSLCAPPPAGARLLASDNRSFSPLAPCERVRGDRTLLPKKNGLGLMSKINF